MYCEIVFENGRSSVMQCADKAEAMKGIAEIHRRAKNGERSLANHVDSAPSDRVVAAYFYNYHPNDNNIGDSLTVDELNEQLPQLVGDLADENGIVSVGDLSVEVRGLTHPMLDDPDVHGTKYKMESVDEFTLGEIDTAADAIDIHGADE